jgi:predicted acetyltransferase
MERSCGAGRPGEVEHMHLSPLANDEIALRLREDRPGDPVREWVRSLHYDIYRRGEPVRVGHLDLRLGYTLNLVRYGGHIGYGIDAAWRGGHYAGQACRLIVPVAVAHGMDVVWITCNPDNWASRKTCLWVGAQLVEEVELPPENDMYARGDRRKCRYRWVLY